jgi:hypothetical protein
MNQNLLRDCIKSKNFKEISFLIAIFTISLLIRWIAVDHGFPLLTHPDEGVILNPIMKMTTERTLNPGNFNRPNQILYLINFFFLNGISFLKYGTSFDNAFPANQLFFYYYARFLIAVLGSLIPVVAYKIGKELRPKMGVLTSLVFAFFPPYISHSLFITPDVPITLFSLLVIYFALRYLKMGQEKYLIIATVFSAITTAEKYPGLISLGIIFLAIIIKTFDAPPASIWHKLWKISKKALIYALIFAVALFIVAPFLFIEYQMVIEALIRESRSTHLGADNLGFTGNLVFYVQSFFNGINLIALFFLAVGIFALLKWKDKYSILLGYGAVYWILLSVLSLHWERWALPMYITPLFLTAIGIHYSLHKLAKNKALKIPLITLTLCFFSLQIISSLHRSVIMTFTDTRVASLNYCEENQITAENSLYEGYTPFYPESPKNIFDENPFEDETIDYIILSSSMFGRYYREPHRYHEQIAFYELLRNNLPLQRCFEPENNNNSISEQLDDLAYFLINNIRQLPTDPRYKGPTIEIYKKLEK